MGRGKVGKGAGIVFVANELGNFRHHREHLVHAARATGLRPVLMAAPVGSRRDLDYDYRPVTIQRFGLHPADLGLFTAVLRLLLKEQPQVLHLINLKPYLYGGLAARLARLLGWRGGVVVTVPGLGRLYDQTNGSLMLRLVRGLVEFFLRIACCGACVTFETEHDREFWLARGLIASGQARVTRGTGIDLDRFSTRRDGSRRDKFTVLFAGRLLRSKGIDVFLDTAARIKDTDGDKVEMLVAGFVENDPDAIPQQELRAHQGIRFLGPVDDMPALLARTDIVVLPSRYNEGVPRILLEAAACGCVPVATRFAGSETLIVPGRTGCFLEAGTPEAQAGELAELIGELARDDVRRHAIGAAAAAHVRENGYSAEAVASTFLGLYEAA